MIEMSHLHTLLAVKKWGSFSRAAQELGVTQSAISQSVKALESKVQVILFRRSGKKVLLTDAGDKLYKMAKKTVLSLEETIKDITLNKNEMSGTIRIGTLSGIGKSWIISRLLDFSKKYPEISLNIHMDFSHNLVRDFEQFHLDFLIVTEEELPQKGEKIPFCKEWVNLVIPKACNFGINRKDLSLELLEQIPLICFEHDDSLFLKWCQKQFGQVPRKMHQRIVVNSHGNILAAVSEGLGIAVVPTHVLERSFYKDHYETLGEKYAVFNNLFYLVFHEDSKELKRMKKLVDVLTSEV